MSFRTSSYSNKGLSSSQLLQNHRMQPRGSSWSRLPWRGHDRAQKNVATYTPFPDLVTQSITRGPNSQTLPRTFRELQGFLQTVHAETWRQHLLYFPASGTSSLPNIPSPDLTLFQEETLPLKEVKECGGQGYLLAGERRNLVDNKGSSLGEVDEAQVGQNSTPEQRPMLTS